MKLTDIWYTEIDKKTGATYGAKAKVLPGENKESAFAELKAYVHDTVLKGSNEAPIPTQEN